MSTVIYARQSNVEDGNLQRQIRECHIYAKEHDLTVTQVLEDKGTGQSKLFDREQGKLLLELISSNAVTVVLAHEISRFTRDRFGAEDLKYIRGAILGAGIELRFVKEGVIDNTWNSDKLLTTASMDSHDTILKIKGWTMGGKYALLEQGKPVFTGQTPYGYVQKYLDGRAKNQNSYREIVPSEAIIIQEIFTQYSHGTQGNEIAQNLNERNIPAPNGKTWSSKAIDNIITRDIYKGLFTWGKSQTVKIDKGNGKFTTSKRVRSEDTKGIDWFEFPLEDLRIVTDKVWGECKQIRDTNKASKRSAITPYLLTGHVVCADCGNPYNGSSNKRTRKDGSVYHDRYYRCKGKCGNAKLDANFVEDNTWGMVLNYIYSDDNIQASLLRIAEGNPVRRIEITQGIEEIAALLKDKSRELTQTVSTIPLLGEGLAREKTVQLLSRIEADISTLELRRGELEAEERTIDIPEDLVNEQVQALRAIAEGANLEERKHIIDKLQVKVLVPNQSEAIERDKQVRKEHGKQYRVRGDISWSVELTLLDTVVYQNGFS